MTVLAKLRRRTVDDRGDISGYIVIMFPVLVGLAGLSHDAGALFQARRQAQGVAAAAARAGANDIDPVSLYLGPAEDGSQGSRPSLTSSATRVASDFARSQGDFTSVVATKLDGQTEVAASADGDRIRVELAGEVDTVFLGIVGFNHFDYEVEALAVAIYSPERGPDSEG